MAPDTPEWQPLHALPYVAVHVEELLHEAEEHYQALLASKRRPYAIGHTLVESLIGEHTEKVAQHWVFEEQLGRWEQEPLTAPQRQAITRLREQVTQLNAMWQAILALAETLKGGPRA
jgi:hypothetical protein